MTGQGTRQLLAEAAGRLELAGVPSAEYDAAELLAHVLGTSRGRLFLAAEITEPQRAAFADLVDRRVRREPLQHLTGTVAFRYVELAVGPGVFVPRPETELLAGWGVEQARAVVASGRVPVVVDLCTGSGAMALALWDEVPSAEIHAVELGAEAHEWAARNLAGTSVDLRQADMAGAFEELSGAVDVVVSNPPYIPLDAYESVAPEARNYDPPMALWSGQDGLDAMNVVERTGARLLRAGGVLGAEHADVQADAVLAIFAGTGRWTEIRDCPDLTGRSRYVTARLAR
ncbi:MAG: peptide chain release factor N(5)-glutamine methyltransferase [Actinomycetota bacterium]|nr:peptide chain release factor N(5)-glutamine methyltransferase [Actinomycetota bacterium]